MRRFSRLRLLLLSLSLALLPCAASAQQFAQTSRPFVQAIQALGMGDAVAAIPSPHTAFFYNPAHYAFVPVMRPIINVVGVRTTFSENAVDQVRFYRKELEPAIDDGLETLSPGELSALYRRALELGERQTLLNAMAPGPSLMLRLFKVGVGGGVFGNGYVNYTYSDAGGGVPQLNMTGVADLIAVAGAAMDLDIIRLRRASLGVNLKYIRRQLTIKEKPIDAMGPDEPFHVFGTEAFAADVGLMYELGKLPLIPGRFYLGASVFDLSPSPFTYDYKRTLAGVYDPAVALLERNRVNDRFALAPSYRVGVAYVAPSFLGLLKQTGIAIDYVSLAEPLVEQDFLTRLHIGVQAHLPFLAIRAGMNQGYPTFGAGVALGFIRLDYAYFGYEEGRTPGQNPGWNHAVQLSLGLF